MISPKFVAYNQVADFKKSNPSKIFSSNEIEILYDKGKNRLLIGESLVGIPVHPNNGLLVNKPLPYKKSFEIDHNKQKYGVIIFQLPTIATVLVVNINTNIEVSWTHHEFMFSTFTPPQVIDGNIFLENAQGKKVSLVFPN